MMWKKLEGASKGRQIEDSWARTMGRLTVGVGEYGVGLSNMENVGHL